MSFENYINEKRAKQQRREKWWTGLKIEY
jgi:hypothetical protein